MELVPRITRAQSMDALSSMASIAGYKAVLLAANTLPRLFPMMTTAAGTIPPARVLVIGAGVAGLQAIATARRLGAVVSGYDVRAAVKEQIESLGAKFVNIDLGGAKAEGEGGYAKALDEDAMRRQREQMADVHERTGRRDHHRRGSRQASADADHPRNGARHGARLRDRRSGGRARRQLRSDASRRDRDRAAASRSWARSNLPATVPYHASQMYARNIVTFLKNMVNKEGQLNIDTERRNHPRDADHARRRGGESESSGAARESTYESPKLR